MKQSLLTLLTVMSVQMVLAQAVVSGTVLDELGEPTIGATIIDSQDPSRGTTTDFDGKYRLELPAGTYDLTFSYVGLADKTVTGVVAQEAKVTFLDVSMQVSSTALDEVVVTAKALQNTENALIMTRLKSDRVLDVISSQEMSKLAVSSAAGAMTKVTGTTVVDGKYIVVRGLGDRYSTAQLNGLTMPSSDPYRNSPQLDLVPSGLLDNIQTSKTFSPDQPGAFTGGNVDLNTKAFPEITTFSASVGVGFNTQSTFNDAFQTYRGGSTDWLGYDDGTRALPGRILEIGATPVPAGRGSTGTVSILNNAVRGLNTTDEANALPLSLVEEVTDIMPLDYATQSATAPLDHSLGLSYGTSHDLGGSKRFGYLVSGSYSRAYTYFDDGTVAVYRLEDPTATGLNTDLSLRDTLSVETPTVAGFATLGYTFAKNQTISANLIYNHTADKSTRDLAGTAPVNNVTGDQYLQNRALFWLERESVAAQLRGEHSLNAASNLRLEWAGGYTLSKQLEPNRRLLAAIADTTDPENIVFSIPTASISRPLSFFRDLRDDQYEGRVDLFKSFAAGHKLQAGGSYRTKERAFSESIYELRVNNERDLPFPYAGRAEDYFRDENLGFGTNRREQERVLNYLVDNTLPANSYDGHERIGAAYLMGTYKFNDRIRAIIGARVETTDLQSINRAENTPDSVRIGEIKATDLLPSINLVYSPIERHNIRASYTQTIARPNMREIALFPSYDFIGGPTFSGNPNLERTNITNYDLRYEFFPRTGALVSVSGFYKEFKNPIVSTFLATQQLEFSYVNVPEARVLGIELEGRTDLGFINERLTALKLGANLSLINSEADVNPEELDRIQTFNPDFPSTRQLQGQSPYIVNANISYASERYGYEVGAAFNIFGDRIAFNGNDGSPDIFEKARGSLDVTLSKSIGPLAVRLVGSNLLNPEYKTSVDYNGQEYVYTSFRRGANVSLSLGYTFQKS